MTEAAHKTALSGIGCALCRVIHGPHEPGPVELHHFRSGGWGKGDYTTLIPLCPEHHRGRFGIHGMGTRAFDRYYGEMHGATQRTLLEWARNQIEQTMDRVSGG